MDTAEVVIVFVKRSFKVRHSACGAGVQWVEGWYCGNGGCPGSAQYQYKPHQYRKTLTCTKVKEL